jgi:hypothetical protein
MLFVPKAIPQGLGNENEPITGRAHTSGPEGPAFWGRFDVGVKTPTYQPRPTGPRPQLEPRGEVVEPVEKPRMHKKMIDEAPALRIGRDVFELSPKVLAVANPVLVKAVLPNFPAKLRAHFM